MVLAQMSNQLMRGYVSSSCMRSLTLLWSILSVPLRGDHELFDDHLGTFHFEIIVGPLGHELSILGSSMLVEP